MARIILHDLSETHRLGGIMAEAVAASGATALLFSGPLGSGNTTLARALVEALPGGDMNTIRSGEIVNACAARGKGFRTATVFEPQILYCLTAINS